MYVRKEAVLSSQIEGTRARSRTCSRGRHSFSQALPGDVDEVINNVAAMNHQDRLDATGRVLNLLE